MPADEASEAAEEEVWCQDQRDQICDYIRRQGLGQARIGDRPAWHVFPYVALWAIESLTRTGSVGWWAISGDLPTDYVTCSGGRHPRDGVRDIARKWQQVADDWTNGRESADITIGATEDRLTLAPMLSSRAQMLLDWTADDTLWDS
jgi:hypothetical protein